MIIYRLIKFEGEMVISINDNNEKLYILKKDLPMGAQEGDYIYVDHFGNFRIDMINSNVTSCTIILYCFFLRFFYVDAYKV